MNEKRSKRETRVIRDGAAQRPAGPTPGLDEKGVEEITLDDLDDVAGGLSCAFTAVNTTSGR